MSDLNQIERKLELLIALARIGLADALEREQAKVAADAVSLSILRTCGTPIAPGKLKDQVRKETSQSKATVERRIAELVSRGALVRETADGGPTYRTTGLLEV